MKIAIIGNGGHSKRIQKILIKKKYNFFVYKPNTPNYFDSKSFSELEKCKIIFIASPNKTHFNYIKKLYKNRYIFCEKPAVTTRKQINFLKQITNYKLYINFNFRFSAISKILNNKKKYKLGNLIYANFSSTNGLALKPEYHNSWRSDYDRCKKGIFEIVSVHFLDLINYHFKIIKINSENINFSNIGNSFDTSFSKITLSNNSNIDIFSSYYAPFTKKLLFIFENGIIEQVENLIKISGPAKNFDRKGFFIKPKKILSMKINEEKDYINSLNESVGFFLKHAKDNKKFSKKFYESSLKSNEFII